MTRPTRKRTIQQTLTSSTESSRLSSFFPLTTSRLSATRNVSGNDNDNDNDVIERGDNDTPSTAPDVNEECPDPTVDSISEDPNTSRADEIRQESDTRRNKRRGKAVVPRSKTSIWTTIACTEITNKKTSCSLCGGSIALSNGSSSNVLKHYRIWHCELFNKIEKAKELHDKKIILENALRSVNGSRKLITDSLTPFPSNITSSQSKQLRSRVAGIIFIAFRQHSFESLGCPTLEAFIDICGGTVDKSKAPYLELLPEVFRVISKLTSSSTQVSKVGGVTYDGWSARLGAPIAGLTFHYIDQNWILKSFPICFMNTVDIGKSAIEHESIIKSALRNNEKLGADVLIFSGTTDNEPSVALGMDQYLNFSGAFRCICHSLSLAVNDSIKDGDFLDACVNNIGKITNYLVMHKSVGAKLVELQCKEYTKDRTISMDKPFQTRWHSKLSVIEKYIIMRPLLQKVLPSDENLIMEDSDERGVAACIDVLREVRRVARELEKDKTVTISRAPRLLKELCDTLHIMSASRGVRSIRVNSVVKPRTSNSKCDKYRDTARTRLIDDEDARLLAGKLNLIIQDRLGHLFEPVSHFDATVSMDDLSENDKKKYRKSKQALLSHCASILDINECQLDWFPGSESEKLAYYEILYNSIAKEIPDLLTDEYDSSTDYVSIIRSTHSHMCSQLNSVGIHCPVESLKWWANIENSSVIELRRRRLYTAPLLIDVARAFLSIQASSAAAERLFGDAGHNEGDRRQHCDDTMTEMLLTIKSFVYSFLENAKTQSSFLTSRAQTVKDLVNIICEEINKMSR